MSISCMTTTGRSLRYIIETKRKPGQEDAAGYGDYVFDAGHACLLPVSFDSSDESERDRVACEVLRLTPDELEAVSDHVGWAVHDATGDAALLVFRPEAIEAVRRDKVHV